MSEQYYVRHSAGGDMPMSVTGGMGGRTSASASFLHIVCGERSPQTCGESMEANALRVANRERRKETWKGQSKGN